MDPNDPRNSPEAAAAVNAPPPMTHRQWKAQHHKKIEVTLILGKKRKTAIYHAPKGQLFTEQAVDDVLSSLAASLEKKMPGEEFRLVPLGKFKFNLVSITREFGVVREKQHDAEFLDAAITDAAAPTDAPQAA